MQKLFTVLVAFLLALTAAAQVSQGKVIYERKMNMHKRMPPEAEQMRAMIPEFNTSKAQLLFNGDESVFKNLPQEEDIRENAGEDGRRMVFRMGGADNETYKNFAKETLVEQRELGSKKYIIEDTLRKLNWKLAEGNKTVNGYNCKMATAKNQRGDELIAWYTEEIPVSAGPESFGGLPGLILAMDIGSGWITYTAETVTKSLEKDVVKVPSNGKKITRKQFQQMMEEAFGPQSGNGGPTMRIIRN